MTLYVLKNLHPSTLLAKSYTAQAMFAQLGIISADRWTDLLSP